MRKVAAARHVTFVDLFTPTRKLVAPGGQPLTINGIHLSEAGDRIVARLLMEGLGLQASVPGSAISAAEMEQLRDLIPDKNQQFF